MAEGVDQAPNYLKPNDNSGKPNGLPRRYRHTALFGDGLLLASFRKVKERS
jgi:hypothetical protein